MMMYPLATCIYYVVIVHLSVIYSIYFWSVYVTKGYCRFVYLTVFRKHQKRLQDISHWKGTLLTYLSGVTPIL